MLKRLDQVAAWGIAAIGVLRASATPLAYKQLSMSAVWFFDAAVVLWLTTALNLLRIRYWAMAPGVRFASVSANVVLLAILLTVLIHTKSAQNLSGAVFCPLVLLPTILSLRARHGRNQEGD